MALYIFYSKDDKDLKRVCQGDSDKYSTCNFKNFENYKYQSARLERLVQAKLAYFIEPDILEVYGKFLFQITPDGKEKIAKGDTLTAYFNTWTH